MWDRITSLASRRSGPSVRKRGLGGRTSSPYSRAKAWETKASSCTPITSWPSCDQTSILSASESHPGAAWALATTRSWRKAMALAAASIDSAWRRWVYATSSSVRDAGHEIRASAKSVSSGQLWPPALAGGKPRLAQALYETDELGQQLLLVSGQHDDHARVLTLTDEAVLPRSGIEHRS